MPKPRAVLCKSSVQPDILVVLNAGICLQCILNLHNNS